MLKPRHSRTRPARLVVALSTLAIAAAPAALAGVSPPTPPNVLPPDYGFEWSVVADPGNRAVTKEEAPLLDQFYFESDPLGGVDYTYRMARSEVTVSQWLEFLNAYKPYAEDPGDPNLVGRWIAPVPIGNGDVKYDAGGEELTYPATAGWRYFARYANWLHNEKQTTAEAFESGAYDTSTFGVDENGDITDQATRSPGAKFWIPSLDEWTKAAHWDPEKNDGKGGYWLYPTTSDDEPVGGPPGAGETSANWSGPFVQLPVGSYPDTMSPWGLLDLSGGEREWMENLAGNGRYVDGQRIYDMGFFDMDRLDVISGGVVGEGAQSNWGMRLASSVPAPSALLVLSYGLVLNRRVPLVNPVPRVPLAARPPVSLTRSQN
ncbi:MAG: SUMF1/EgtB/PvdO family nonheme iron enzyme [Planctomycetota bacterium]|nr:SUMF1/EgtB/PvdO family nonheme iron enzyme [Planctomycetota bacterium]